MIFLIMRELGFQMYYEFWLKDRLPQASPVQQWALAAGGPLAKMNMDTFVTLRNARSRGTVRHGLREWWDVSNRQEALQQLEWLEVEGHRTAFKKMLAVARSRQSIGQPALQDLLLNQTFACDDLVAWDMGRLINVCRFAYTVGYIDEKLAWEKIMLAARLIQQNHTSWAELGDNYLLGWRYWQGGAPVDENLERANQWLKHDPASPWQQLPWQTPLR